MYLLLLPLLFFHPQNIKISANPTDFKLAMQQSMVIIKETDKSHMY